MRWTQRSTTREIFAYSRRAKTPDVTRAEPATWHDAMHGFARLGTPQRPSVVKKTLFSFYCSILKTNKVFLRMWTAKRKPQGMRSSWYKAQKDEKPKPWWISCTRHTDTTRRADWPHQKLSTITSWRYLTRPTSSSTPLKSTKLQVATGGKANHSRLWSHGENWGTMRLMVGGFPHGVLFPMA